MVSNIIRGAFERLFPEVSLKKVAGKKKNRNKRREKRKNEMKKDDPREINEAKLLKEGEPLSFNWLLTLAEGLL